MSQVATKAESRAVLSVALVRFELLAVATDQRHAQAHLGQRAGDARPIPLPAPVTSAVFKVAAKPVSFRSDQSCLMDRNARVRAREPDRTADALRLYGLAGPEATGTMLGRQRALGSSLHRHRSGRSDRCRRAG